MSNFKIKDQDGNYIKLLSDNDKTTNISATSTDEQVPTAKAVYDAIGQSGGELQEGIGIEITKEEQATTISAKIGTNSELGVVKGDGITTFVDPDGTITSKSTLPDITAGQGIDIKYGTGNNLPEEYVELLFVRGKAQCYLDTGVNADDTTAFEVVAQRLANPSESFNVFGAVKTGAVSGVQFLNNNNGRCFVGTYSTDYTPTVTNVFFDKIKFYGDVNKRIVTNMATGEVTENTTAYTTQFDVGKNYWLGKINGLTAGADFTGRIFEAKIWQNNVLVRHYIPAKVRLTQEIGFYDIVNGTFNKSATASQFIEGADAVPSTVISNIEFQGATLEKDGTIGGVPAPTKDDLENTLLGTGKWELPIVKKRVLNGDENNEIRVYVSEWDGKDVYEFGRGLDENKPFATINGALEVISKLYILDTDNGSLFISAEQDKFYPAEVPPIDIPYIESKNTSLRLEYFKIMATDEAVALRNCGGIDTVIKGCEFYVARDVAPKTIIQISDSNVTFEAEDVRERSYIRTETYTGTKEPTSQYILIENNGKLINKSYYEEDIEENAFFIYDQRSYSKTFVKLVNSTIITQGGFFLTGPHEGIFYDATYSSIYILNDHKYQVGLTPYILNCSNIYLPNNVFEELFNPKGTRDKVSYAYDTTGIH